MSGMTRYDLLYRRPSESWQEVPVSQTANPSRQPCLLSFTDPVNPCINSRHPAPPTTYAGDGIVDVVEFESYLNKGWKSAKALVQSQKDGKMNTDDPASEMQALSQTNRWKRRGEMEREVQEEHEKELERRLATRKSQSRSVSPSGSRSRSPSPHRRSSPTPSHRKTPPLPQQLRPKTLTSTLTHGLPASLEERIQGLEVFEYLARVCEISQVQRPAPDQAVLVEKAQRQLNARRLQMQHEKERRSSSH